MAKKSDKKQVLLDTKLVAMAEKARKNVGRSVLPVNVAETIVKSASKSNNYDSVKKTINHLIANYYFDTEGKKVLKQSLKPNSTVPAKKKVTSKAKPKKTIVSQPSPKLKKPKKLSKTDFWDADGDETISFAGEEVAPTPEYHELIELDRYAKSQQEPDRNWKLILLLLGVALLLVFLAKTFIVPHPKQTYQSEETETFPEYSDKPEQVIESKPVVEVKSGSEVKSKTESKPQPVALPLPVTEKPKQEKPALEKAPTIVKLENPVAFVLDKPTLSFSTKKKAVNYISEVKVPFKGRTLELGEGGLESLSNLAEAMRQYSGLKIRIKGHTCFNGEADENQILSENRALLVYQTLIRESIDPSRLEKRGYGEKQSLPETSDYTIEGRRKNRRVDFAILEYNFAPKNP